MKRPLLPKKIFCVLAALLIGCAPAASSSAPVEPESAPTVYAKPTAVALTHPDFFGGEEALAQRQSLDETKRQLCSENAVRLIEWPYDMPPTDKNIKKMLSDT